MQRQPGDGLIVWYDLMSTDPAVTDAFYAGVFGWTVEAGASLPNGYRSWTQHGETFGGVLPWDAAAGPGSWLGYVQISALDDLVDLTEELGGTVHVEPTEIPAVGRFAIIADEAGRP